MFKKLFRSLTQSSEDLYLEEMEAQAVGLAERGAVQMSHLLRRFASLKKLIDEKIENRDASLLEVTDFEDHAKGICDEVRSKIQELATTETALCEVVSGRELARLNAHFDQWRHGNERLMRAYATLHHAATGDGPKDPLVLSANTKTSLDEAVERLAVEIRTAERIKYELGG